MSVNHLRKYLLTSGLVFLPAVAWSQFAVPPAFRNASEPQWRLTGSAQLTAATPPGYDPDGSGWLRLTENTVLQNGSASYTGATFSAVEGIVIDFDYVMWMRHPGNNLAADGLSFYLYDASLGMNGSNAGADLGYCGGQGGYLGVGFDAFGFFSTDASCGGPGGTNIPRVPNTIAVRGPTSEGNPFVANASVPALSNPNATARPVDRSARIMLTPTGDTNSPFLLSVLDGPSGAPEPIITNQPFPYISPEQLSIGFSGSTGGATQVHEVRLNSVSVPADVQIDVAMTTPASRRLGETVMYSLSVKNNTLSNSPLSANIDDPASAPLINSRIPELINKTWTCTATGAGTSCPAASGSGDIADLGNYMMGQDGDLTFLFQGEVDPAATCDASVGNMASITFTDGIGFVDQDPSNNRSTSDAFVVDCSEPPIIITPPAAPQPIPTIGVWGLGLLSLGLMGWGAGFNWRRHRKD
ncbi:MAG: hypothetical protein LBE58_13860 [Comamonas sp.]|nr:hypothetical protein [Comamonas sp.]